MSLNSDEKMEKALRASLRRQAAPADFAANILAKTRGPLRFPVFEGGKLPGPKLPKFWLRRPFTLALAAAVMAAAIVPAVVLDYQRREQARGLKAKQDLLTALAITRDQLQRAGDKVRRSTRSLR
jgi:hypothetical protein